MKNIFIAIFSILSISLVAQDATTNEVVVENTQNSNGPKEGDFTIGLDMIPLLRIVGDNETGNMQTFIGKYFMSDDFAIRTRIGVGMENASNSQFVNDDTNIDPLSRAKVEDVESKKSGDFVFAIGGEFRNNFGKLSTFYGAELVGLYGYNSADYQRGNAFTSVNNNPTSFDFGWGIPEDIAGSRMVSKSSSYWGAQANILVGAEYYFTKRLAVGSEIAWGYQYSNESQKSHINEYYMAGSVREETIVSKPNDVTNSIGFTMPHISLYMMFSL